MTLRDQIAIAAMQEFLRHRLPAGIDRDILAESAYGVADAMLKERGTPEGDHETMGLLDIASAIRELTQAMIKTERG
jgi:hypothetical protein